MGRCPVRSVFPEALALLEKVQDKLEYEPPFRPGLRKTSDALSVQAHV